MVLSHNCDSISNGSINKMLISSFPLPNFLHSRVNKAVAFKKKKNYLNFYQPFHSLNFCLTKGTPVLGTDICSHCQVGRLIPRLKKGI